MAIWNLTSVNRQTTGLRPCTRGLAVLAIAAALCAGLASPVRAQDDPGQTDDSIDSLLQKLSGDTGPADKPSAKAAKDQKPKAAAAKDTQKPAAKKDEAKPKKPRQAPELTGQDKDVDDFLQKLGETEDKPTPEERPRGGGGEKADDQAPAKGPGPVDRNRLTGKDKETDEHLEGLTGRKRRKKQDDGERTGAAGQVIKEMRDIEKKLSQPDTGEGTRQEQKQVVKEIDKMIEQARQSGGSSMRRVVRRVRQPGQQGQRQQQNGDQGAQARGAPNMKPLAPTNRHSTAGGKDIWGHLPPELRAEKENTMNEQPLASKEELVDRYYLSVGKGKPKREDSP